MADELDGGHSRIVAKRDAILPGSGLAIFLGEGGFSAYPVYSSVSAIFNSQPNQPARHVISMHFHGKAGRQHTTWYG